MLLCIYTYIYNVYIYMLMESTTETLMVYEVDDDIRVPMTVCCTVVFIGHLTIESN